MTSSGYDYVIIGAGSAGCVLASRLTEDPAASVLLLEAGPPDRNPLISVPLGLGKLHEYKLYDWGYKTEPEPNLHNRRIDAMRGKVLGGSSSINVMTFTRGNRADYDRWAQKGARGWTYADVLPYFRRLETWEGGENRWRGSSGPIGIEFSKTTDPLFPAWVEAGKAAGIPANSDYNADSQEGFGRGQYNVRDGRRSSSSRAYLRPIRKRANLTVETGVQATRLLMQGTRATGVEYKKASGNLVRVTATAEVIVSAGAFNSPQLLMLSGIGPAEHLQQLGIPTIVDLPVGKNLQDHLGTYMGYSRKNPGWFHREMRIDRMAVNMIRAYLFGKGPATVIPSGLHAFVKTRPELAVPDIEFMFRGTSFAPYLWFPVIRPAYEDGIGIRPTILHPDSRGELLLRSADPLAPPRICYNFFTAPNDLPTLRQGFKIARDIMDQKPLDPFRGEETKPGKSVKTDAQIDDWLRGTVVTANHPCGTCQMGTTPDTVLDPQLRVRGIERLRVVDASAMPDLVSAHINACVIMMAEKASDMIRGREELLPAVNT